MGEALSLVLAIRLAASSLTAAATNSGWSTARLAPRSGQSSSRFLLFVRVWYLSISRSYRSIITLYRCCSSSTPLPLLGPWSPPEVSSTSSPRPRVARSAAEFAGWLLGLKLAMPVTSW